MTDNQYQTQSVLFFFFKCHFPTSERYIPADSPSLRTGMLFTHHISAGVSFSPCVKSATLKRRSFWGYFMLQVHNSAFCFNFRLLFSRQWSLCCCCEGGNCCSHDARSLIKSDSSIDSLPDSLRLWCFDGVFSTGAQSWPGMTIMFSASLRIKVKWDFIEWQHGRLGSCYSNSVCKPGWEGEVTSIMFNRQTLNWSKCKTFRCSEIS